MRHVVSILLAVASAILLAGGFTAWALESSGVATLTTLGLDGERITHVWYVEQGARRLVEAGTPENGWYVDVLIHPEVVFESDAHRGRYRARPLPNPEGHRDVRRRLREKYGLRDAWISLLFDTDRSVAVVLEPAS